MIRAYQHRRCSGSPMWDEVKKNLVFLFWDLLSSNWLSNNHAYSSTSVLSYPLDKPHFHCFSNSLLTFSTSFMCNEFLLKIVLNFINVIWLSENFRKSKSIWWVFTDIFLLFWILVCFKYSVTLSLIVACDHKGIPADEELKQLYETNHYRIFIIL